MTHMRALLAALAAASFVGACNDAPPPEPADGDASGEGELVAAAGDFSQPLKGLTPEQVAEFEVGREDFAEIEDVEDGLGPVFNGTGCGVCHGVGGIGGGNANIFEVRAGLRRADGTFDPLDAKGGSLFQVSGIGDLGQGCVFDAEPVPPEANVVAPRRAQPLFGLGLIDAVPDQFLELLAASEPAEVRGRVARVDNISAGRKTAGKLGWKSQNPTLFQFAGDAYLNEMGITSPEFPDENCPGGDCELLARCNPQPGLNDDGEAIINFDNFMRFLAPVPRLSSTFESVAGEIVFVDVGCADCHTPKLVTGPSDVEALNFKAFAPFSDFLLHDMGGLGDGIAQGDAGPTEMRTQPLWGLRLVTRFLHDGRAPTIEAAIAAHDGQGAKARDRFAARSSFERKALVAFLKRL